MGRARRRGGLRPKSRVGILTRPVFDLVLERRAEGSVSVTRPNRADRQESQWLETAFDYYFLSNQSPPGRTNSTLSKRKSEQPDVFFFLKTPDSPHLRRDSEWVLPKTRTLDQPRKTTGRCLDAIHANRALQAK